MRVKDMLFIIGTLSAGIAMAFVFMTAGYVLSKYIAWLGGY